ncbi:hypothetical protein K505DRAFT_413565 [Melanomma pulvis-pyrius CBS 109.77]|uniref:Uncharacterized protein n=1 Tax=Melanomma pulvis-pyrius CBS 109.77 TaxID=1314802 RepID=A0A6A6XVF8_9PLEO|nr:hypothetical protein K505DRAFT_413565 [Melanomma pulvis-pyrius CBS 109.77]
MSSITPGPTTPRGTRGGRIRYELPMGSGSESEGETGTGANNGTHRKYSSTSPRGGRAFERNSSHELDGWDMPVDSDYRPSLHAHPDRADMSAPRHEGSNTIPGSGMTDPQEDQHDRALVGEAPPSHDLHGNSIGRTLHPLTTKKRKRSENDADDGSYMRTDGLSEIETLQQELNVELQVICICHENHIAALHRHIRNKDKMTLEFSERLDEHDKKIQEAKDKYNSQVMSLMTATKERETNKDKEIVDLRTTNLEQKIVQLGIQHREDQEKVADLLKFLAKLQYNALPERHRHAPLNSALYKDFKPKNAYIHSDGKVGPFKYGSDSGWDLGLCFSHFRTHRVCYLADKCEWRHKALSEDEREYIRSFGGVGRAFLIESDKCTSKKPTSTNPGALGWN